MSLQRKSAQTQRRRRADEPAPEADGAAGWVVGAHAVRAALANPRRRCRRVVGRPGVIQRLAEALAARPGLPVESADDARMRAILGPGLERTDVALACDPPPRRAFEEALDEIAGARRAVLLDQVVDPRNLGAILRSAVAFGIDWAVTTERRSAPSSAVAASAAAGALDIQNVAETGNLARAIGKLKERGYWVIGLDARGERSIDELGSFDRAAMVIGAEGAGLRRLTAERCDLLVRIPIAPAMESLNASVAAGVALRALAQATQQD